MIRTLDETRRMHRGPARTQSLDEREALLKIDEAKHAISKAGAGYDPHKMRDALERLRRLAEEFDRLYGPL